MSNWCEQKHSVLHKTIPGSRLVDWLQSTVRAVLTRSQASNIWQVLVDEELLDNGKTFCAIYLIVKHYCLSISQMSYDCLFFALTIYIT